MITFTIPNTVITGTGCLCEAGKQAKRLGRSALMVTGRASARKSGALSRVCDLLTEAGIKVEVFAGVEHDPACETVDAARDMIRSRSCDMVVGMGGGSALDVAKAAAALCHEDEPTRAFYDGLPIPGRGLPIMAIPTTFGTGSEATRVSVLSSSDRDADGREIATKKSIRHDCMLPQVAIVDPALGVYMPPRLTAACGMDALTQAIESYFSRYANDLTDGLAMQAVRLLAEGLPRSVTDGGDIRSREQCACGSLLAGMALHNARLGLVHGMAHPLGIRHGIPHGEICAMLLPHVLRFNREAVPKKYSMLSALFGTDAADFCNVLLERFGLPRTLNLPMSDSELSWLVQETLSSGSTQANPRAVSADNVISIAKLVMARGR
mgnify:CR=1 FL=1